MRKSLLSIILGALLLVSCTTLDLEIRVNSDIIILNQRDEDFNFSMIDEFVSVYYGDSEKKDATIEYEGDVNLREIGVYEIILTTNHKNKIAEKTIEITVVDTIKPEFLIFEKELLVYTGEQISIDSHNFFINLIDGLNGLINNRIKVDGEYDLKTVGTYPIKLVGTDVSGNEAEENMNVRVTDIIDEKALYLYEKANVAVHGKSFVFKDNDINLEIINEDDALAIFTPNYREHFLWLSGVTGTYNNKQSGVALKREDGNLYADYSLANKVNGYEKTKLTIQYETDTYRHYLAESFYMIDGEEVIKNSRFVIRNIDGIWLVEEFYMPN